MFLTTALISTLAAADVQVVVSRRSGVAKPQANDVAKAVLAGLDAKAFSVGKAPLDGTSCNGKKPCLMALGRKEGAAGLVLLEVALVLDDGVVRAEAVSVEEDGRRVALAEYEGALTAKAAITQAVQKLNAPLKALVAGDSKPAEPAKPPEVTKPVEAAKPPAVAVKPAPVSAPVSAPAPAPAPKPAEPPVVAATPPPPAPAVSEPPTEVSVQPAPAAGMSGVRVVGLVVGGLGVAAVVAGIVFGTQALSNGARSLNLCPAGQPCTNPAAFSAYTQAAQAQNLGLGLTVGGAAAAALGLVLFVVGGSAPADAPKPALWLGPDGAGAVVRGTW